MKIALYVVTILKICLTGLLKNRYSISFVFRPKWGIAVEYTLLTVVLCSWRENSVLYFLNNMNIYR